MHAGCKFGAQFARVAAGSRIEVLRTPVWTPRANAICERFLGVFGADVYEPMPGTTDDEELGIPRSEPPPHYAAYGRIRLDLE